jgi:hypothetical protein
MTATINTHHDCADHGCLAAMLGLATNGDPDEDSSTA